MACKSWTIMISIHTPLAGSDDVSARLDSIEKISIHTPLAGSDCWTVPSSVDSVLFQSTLPLRGATVHHAQARVTHVISIHTPLAGSDQAELLGLRGHGVISIHTPLAGSDSLLTIIIRSLSQFQSTLPLRGATGTEVRWRCVRHYFNPHSPCGERHTTCYRRPRLGRISIHTPLAGSDFSSPSLFGSAIKFQSTLPLRGATCSNLHITISHFNFNPHSPCGERPCSTSPNGTGTYFNPHSPCGERLYLRRTDKEITNFNPHSPCGERPRSGCRPSTTSNFNPHSPCGERPDSIRSKTLTIHFNPHSPCGERLLSLVRVSCEWYFNPHSPCGERQTNTTSTLTTSIFQSTLPLRGATPKLPA